MKTETTTSTTSNRLKWIILGFVFILFSQFASAQNYYFKCTSGTAGIYNWSTLANWYVGPTFGAATAATLLPDNTKDVFLVPGTFTAATQTILFDGSTSLCNNFSILPSTFNFAGCKLSGATSHTFNVTQN